MTDQTDEVHGPVLMTRPGYRPPPHLTDDPSSSPVETISDPEEPGSDDDQPPQLEPIAARRSTRGSSPRGSRATVAATRDALVGLLAIVWAGVWWATRRRGVGLSLREPSPAQYASVAEPLAEIAGRHVPMELAPDVVRDILDASATVGGLVGYLRDGPLLVSTDVDVRAEGESE